MSVALAWLLQRSPNVLLTPGTSSVAHLRENIAGATITLSKDDVRQLDQIAGDPRCRACAHATSDTGSATSPRPRSEHGSVPACG